MKVAVKLSKKMLFLGLLGLWLAGCGTEKGPVASEQAEFSQAEDGTVFLTFTPEAARRAGKIAAIPEEGRSVWDLFTEDGGYLIVSETNGKGPKDNLIVEFEVPRGALDIPCPISMTVYGNTLSELVIAFWPGGLQFLEDAELIVTIGSELADISTDQLVVHHHYESGAVEEASITSLKNEGKARLTFVTAVPGFSRFSMAGNP